MCVLTNYRNYHLHHDLMLVCDDLTMPSFNWPATDIEEFAAAAKPAMRAENDLISISSFDPECALWPSIRCSEAVFEMNDALALRLDKSGALIREDYRLFVSKIYCGQH